MTDAPRDPVTTVLVLAAGNGDRFQNESRQSKLLQCVAGRPLILRTLERAREAGAATVEMVLGYQAAALRAVVERHAPHGLDIHFSFNPDWHLENGVSVLAARGRLARDRFALLMGDHLFDPDVLAGLLRSRAGGDESLLAIDARPAPPEVAAEATKVRLQEDRIVAIGKDLAEYDALDTGMFVCSPLVFEAIEEARAGGDTTLSGGIRRLAARGLMRGVDIGDRDWCDIDTVADLEHAERLVAGAEAHA